MDTPKSSAAYVASKLYLLANTLKKATNEPHDEQQRLIAEVHDRLKGVMWLYTPPHEGLLVEAWCVVKTSDYPQTISSPRPWPGQVYLDKNHAEAWREFLEDYYYNIRIRDGEERWTVEWMTCEARHLARAMRDHTEVGDGYERPRSPWVGTLPMRIYEWDISEARWIKTSHID